MCETLQIPTTAPPYLDKLAQSGKSWKKIQQNLPIPTKNGKKTGPVLTLGRKRANGKYFTRFLQKTLFYGCPESPLRNSYFNTFFCTHAVEIKGGQEFTTYCKNRWCLPCARIRTANYINAYLPQLKEMSNPQFVTLSRRNVPGENLRDEINELIKLRIALMDAEKKHRKKYGLGKLQALWKIEVTYNEARNDFHPHFHAILQDSDSAERTVLRWLSFKQNSGKVSAKAQDVKPVKDENSARELFKYFTKLISKDRQTGQYKIYDPLALDCIFQAMRKRQVYTPYGMKKPPEDYLNKTTEGLNLDPNFDYFFLWNQSLADWIEQKTGEFLTGNTPSEKIKSIFQK
jgi:hypothetical protein